MSYRIMQIKLHFLREAVQKMGRDILACRDYINNLKAENTKLKSKMATLQEPIHDISLNNIPKEDLVKEVLQARKILREEVCKDNTFNEFLILLRNHLLLRHECKP